tara:strand:+ start:1543 stop:1782 length:240 start_codon:yes stop_codon:yes gene_type:complete
LNEPCSEKAPSTNWFNNDHPDPRKRPKAMGFGPIKCRAAPEVKSRIAPVWRLVSAIIPDFGTQNEIAKQPRPTMALAKN